MRRLLATALGICLLTAGSPAYAGPPSLCRLDPVIVHGISEFARTAARSARPESGAKGDAYALATIVLDPGHGGANRGAVGVAEFEEKYLTLHLAYALRDEIERRHPQVRVLLTRYWDRDVDLPMRIAWANDIGADVFLSLHYNAATHDRAIGYETYFLASDVLADTDARGERAGQPGTSQQKRARRLIDRARAQAQTAARAPLLAPHEHSQRLAATVQAQLALHLVDSPDRGVKSANFAVLRGALMPAVVIESGFLTHPAEGMRVLSDGHRRAVVLSIADALDRFEADSPAAPLVPESVAATAPDGKSKQPQNE